MQAIAEVIAHYATSFPAESDRLAGVRAFAASTPAERLYDRRNFDGHVVASGLVLDPAGTSLLLIAHKALGRWLQPGGHVEPGETPMEAALREAAEETGIGAAHLTPVAGVVGEGLPFDIDSHLIPARPQRGEPAHWHHDFRYLLRYDGCGELRADAGETEGLRWVPLADVELAGAFGSLGEKLRHSLGS